MADAPLQPPPDSAAGIARIAARAQRSSSLADHYAIAARTLATVLSGRTLDAALADAPPMAHGERAALLDFCHSTLRAFGRVQLLVRHLASRPPAPDTLLALLYIVLTDLARRPERAYVAVDQAVRAVRMLGLHPATGFVNAILRGYVRRSDELAAVIAADEEARLQHPRWWINTVRAAWPDAWVAALDAGNSHPPMTVRVNLRRSAVDDYMAKLIAAGLRATALDDQAVLLEQAVPVSALPGFACGEVSVQDWGAQRAARYLDARPGQRVLDACAAPGGKAAHILERTDCDLIALDHDAARLVRVSETFVRLGLNGTVCAGDAAQPGDWWDGRPFDRILVDAPCSASGIARRRPDIKWRRRESDLAGLRDAQLRMLDALWKTLAPGGKLLYATCSVFPIENGQCMEQFLSRHPDARPEPLADLPAGQLLPAPTHDGFFYARVGKC